MNVLITGGCGYVGSILTPYLLSKGHAVTVLDSLRFKQKPHLDLCNNPNFNIVEGDCREHSVLSPLLRKHDVIIHLAAIVGAEACDQNSFDARTTNVDATKLLVDNVAASQWILFPCTNSGYGVGQEGIHCTEDSPLRPISLYGRSKVEAESLVLSRENSISFRLATVFGAAPCFRTELLVNDFVRRAVLYKAVNLFEPHFKRNYIHIRDVAKAFGFGLDNFDQMKSNVYNLGLSTANLSKLELCNVIKKYVDFQIVINEGMKDPDQRNYIVSNDKIESLGFYPSCSLDDGIQELIKAYKITTCSYHER